jgi:hypothetical protein
MLYARALCSAGATLDDTREAVNTLEDTERTARRVYGGAHPLTGALEEQLQVSRAVLRTRERHAEEVLRLREEHAKEVEQLRSEHAAASAAAREELVAAFAEARRASRRDEST